MKKHKFNIFPDASEEDYGRLVSDIRQHGYDETLPIVLYQGAILDGWSRYRACAEIGIEPVSIQFDGDDAAAIQFTVRTNKRRNLTSSQWAAVAVEADEIIAAIAEAVEQERRSKIAESRQSETSQLIDQSKNHNDSKAAHKAAELFNTNRTYINDAKKLREASPEHFEKIKSGRATLTQVKREMKEQAREARREENRAKVASIKSPQEIVGWTRDPNKRCDYILWLWQDTGRFCLVPFQMLCKVFSGNWMNWKSQFKTRKQKTRRASGDYHSECVFVPRREVWAEIYRQFGGTLEVTKA